MAKPHSVLRPISAGMAVGVAAFGLMHAIGTPVNHDVAWLLHVSGAVLDGAQPYRDVIEINPPLIIALGFPAAALERVTDTSAVTTFPWMVALAALASLLVAYRIAQLPETYRSGFLVALAIGLFIVPIPMWGQREHFLLILTTPYVVACASRAVGVMPRGGGQSASPGAQASP